MKRVATAAYRILTRFEEVLLAGGILMIALLTIINVLGRMMFSESLAAAEELSQFLMIMVTFVGAGYAAGQGRHIRMSALYEALSARKRKVAMIVIASTTAGLMFLLAYLAGRYVWGTVYELGARSPVLQVPLYLVYMVAPLGFVLAGCQYLLVVVRNFMEDDVFIAFDVRDHVDEREETEATR